MLGLIARELRRTVGHVLQTVATRLLATRAGLPRLQGDPLTQVGKQYGCDRETDDEYRERVVDVARNRAGLDPVEAVAGRIAARQTKYDIGGKQ